MKQMTFIPYESIGSVRFGSTREIVRKDNPKYIEFRKNKFSRNTTDNYGLYHVFYTKENCVEAVEVFKGIDIVLDGVTISHCRQTNWSAICQTLKWLKKVTVLTSHLMVYLFLLMTEQ